MAGYVDGFVLPISTNKLADYRRLAKKASKMWMKHGALEYRECVGEELDTKCGLPFPKVVKTKAGETIVFAWIRYQSKAHRNRVNASVMSDPGLAKLCDPKKLPFDVKRMLHGGFKVIVEG